MILRRRVTARQLLPRDVYFWLKAMLLALVAIQGARLFWTIVTPLGPVGRWLPATPATIPEAAQLALLSTFDPFTAAQAQAAAAPSAPVTGLTLVGTRMSLGGAPASAIIAASDGVQTSFTVGEEVAPGLRLVSVGFDFVLLGANGSEQRLAMPSDEPATTATAGVEPGGTTAGAAAALTAAAIRDNVALAPRMVGGRVTGLLVSAIGDPGLLSRVGLRDGDVITAANGRPVTSQSALLGQLTPGARLSLTVERGAATVPVALLLEGNR